MGGACSTHRASEKYIPKVRTGNLHGRKDVAEIKLAHLLVGVIYIAV